MPQLVGHHAVRSGHAEEGVDVTGGEMTGGTALETAVDTQIVGIPRPRCLGLYCSFRGSLDLRLLGPLWRSSHHSSASDPER